MLDGKIMLTDSLPFPKIAGSDHKEDSLLPTTLRRNTSHSRLNLNLCVGKGFDGETGALYIFNDSVSDASFRSLFDATGRKRGAPKRSSSSGDVWDAKKSQTVRRSRVLDVNLTNDDAEEIVLSRSGQRPGSRKQSLERDF